MTKPKATGPVGNRPSPNKTPEVEPPLAAKDHYEREKARRARHAPADSEAMASARREYQAMLETNAAKGKGGRPKKQPAPPKPDDDALVESDTGEE